MKMNRLEPKKRTFHTLNPAMLCKNNRQHLVYGTMGGEESSEDDLWQVDIAKVF
ncbi:gamma-glutamyltransferase [Gracilibacillus sp. D59]|uniref:gamma-glutamyltransferase n=1 Tax=Gracilibacillus sp. D59 TaxID=3457434 RepID=UPI003FCCFEF6